MSGPPASSSEHLDVGILAQPRREHAARRAGPDDHVVSRHFGTTSGRSAKCSLTRMDVAQNCARVRLTRDVRATCSGSTGRSPARSRCTSGASGASSTCADRCEHASRVGFQGHRTLARRPRARARDTFAQRGQAAPRRQRPRVPRARVPDGLVPRPRRRAARRVRHGSARCCSRRPPRSMRTTSRSATSRARRVSCPQLTERYGELCADAAEQHDARVVYEFMPFDVNVHDLDSALAVVEGADAPNGGLAIDTWHMAKLGIEPGRAAPHPAAPPRLGRAQRRPLREHARPDRRDGQPPQAPRRGRVPDPRLRRRLPRGRLRRARGASRCSRRSCATCRSSRSSTEPTRRACRSSSPNRKGASVSERPRQRPADLDVHADGCGSGSSRSG